jgi:hypothetical protein
MINIPHGYPVNGESFARFRFTLPGSELATSFSVLACGFLFACMTPASGGVAYCGSFIDPRHRPDRLCSGQDLPVIATPCVRAALQDVQVDSC